MNSTTYYEPLKQRISHLESRMLMLEMKVIKLITALEFIKDMSLNSEITAMNESVPQVFPM
jgi:prefoldin subunit 5